MMFVNNWLDNAGFSSFDCLRLPFSSIGLFSSPTAWSEINTLLRWNRTYLWFSAWDIKSLLWWIYTWCARSIHNPVIYPIWVMAGKKSLKATTRWPDAIWPWPKATGRRKICALIAQPGCWCNHCMVSRTIDLSCFLVGVLLVIFLLSTNFLLCIVYRGSHLKREPLLWFTWLWHWWNLSLVKVLRDEGTPLHFINVTNYEQ